MVHHFNVWPDVLRAFLKTLQGLRVIDLLPVEVHKQVRRRQAPLRTESTNVVLNMLIS